ncbi:MAG: hypothetical protein A3B70_07655 [Deltaproteobacteria bacterium RIFCSPHIGHO2_02_FULL_40_11]|nr:MAG: hypothetical protein A3B70_07655 [Deltaproteobacteria bacterium RIFCSPHIGHO2_02_FULL_40_11]
MPKKKSPKLEVDVKSIQNLIQKRVSDAQKRLMQFEGEASKIIAQWVKYGWKSRKEGRKQFEKLLKELQKTVNGSIWVKNFKKTNAYTVALKAKDELEKRVGETQERVFDLLNVPTKTDIYKLDQKVNRLTRELKEKEKTLERKSA